MSSSLVIWTKWLEVLRRGSLHVKYYECPLSLLRYTVNGWLYYKDWDVAYLAPIEEDGICACGSHHSIIHMAQHNMAWKKWKRTWTLGLFTDSLWRVWDDQAPGQEGFWAWSLRNQQIKRVKLNREESNGVTKQIQKLSVTLWSTNHSFSALCLKGFCGQCLALNLCVFC